MTERTLDSHLADELRHLEQMARDIGGDDLAETIRGAAFLAADGDHATLARLSCTFGAAALMLQRGGDQAFGILHQFSRAIVYRMGLAPRRALRRYVIDELTAALGRLGVQLAAALSALDDEMRRNAELRARVAQLQGDGLRDAAREKLQGTGPMRDCCRAAGWQALVAHYRDAHPAGDEPHHHGARIPANDSAPGPS